MSCDLYPDTDKFKRFWWVELKMEFAIVRQKHRFYENVMYILVFFNSGITLTEEFFCISKHMIGIIFFNRIAVLD